MVVVEVVVVVVLVVVDVVVVVVVDVVVLVVVDVVTVLVVVDVVTVLVVLVVVVVVVVAHTAGVFGGLKTAAHEVGSVRGAVQEQVPALHASVTKLLQFLAAMPDRRPPSMTLTSSEQFFEPQSGGAAFAPAAKTPAQSATATNVTTAFLVIVEPPMAVPSPRSVSAL